MRRKRIPLSEKQEKNKTVYIIQGQKRVGMETGERYRKLRSCRDGKCSSYGAWVPIHVVELYDYFISSIHNITGNMKGDKK